MLSVRQVKKGDPVREQTVGAWLRDLASAAPAPGGGAAAAMNAAVGAALVAMVCNLTIGKAGYAEHEQTMTEALAQANTRVTPVPGGVGPVNHRAAHAAYRRGGWSRSMTAFLRFRVGKRGVCGSAISPSRLPG
jgi:hypothetical protein